MTEKMFFNDYANVGNTLRTKEWKQIFDPRDKVTYLCYMCWRHFPGRYEIYIPNSLNEPMWRALLHIYYDELPDMVDYFGEDNPDYEPPTCEEFYRRLNQYTEEYEFDLTIDPKGNKNNIRDVVIEDRTDETW